MAASTGFRTENLPKEVWELVKTIRTELNLSTRQVVVLGVAAIDLLLHHTPATTPADLAYIVERTRTLAPSTPGRPRKRAQE